LKPSVYMDLPGAKQCTNEVWLYLYTFSGLITYDIILVCTHIYATHAHHIISFFGIFFLFHYFPRNFNNNHQSGLKRVYIIFPLSIAISKAGDTPISPHYYVITRGRNDKHTFHHPSTFSPPYFNLFLSFIALYFFKPLWMFYYFEITKKQLHGRMVTRNTSLSKVT